MPLKLTRRHGSPYWYVRGSVRGLRVDESTGCSVEEDAEAVLITRAAQLLQQSIHGDALSRSFAEAALSYIEAGGERKHLGPLIRRLGKLPVGRIGQAEIDDAAKTLCPQGSPSTQNRQIYTPASAVLHHAARKKWCAKPVIARPKQPQGRVRWITYEEADKLIEAAAPHIRPLVVFLLSTGARLSEALYLDWRDVDLSAGHVVFKDTKNGESRGVPLHPRAVAELANLPWGRGGMVFRKPVGRTKPRTVGRRRFNVTGRQWEPYEDREGEGGGQIKTAWRGMLKRAAIRDFTPHDCRHTWATWHYAANRDLRALMELGGWKSADMVVRYAHVNASHLAPSMARIWGNRGESAASAPDIALVSKAE